MSEGEGEITSALSPTLIGSVVLGILIAVLLTQGGGNDKNKSKSTGGGFSEQELVKESAPASGAGTAAKTSKKKKKKPNKKKTAAAPAPAPVPEPEPVAVEETPEEEEEDDEEDPILMAAAAKQNGKKKKKKKSANKTAEPVVAKAPEPEPTPAPAPEPVAEPDPATTGKKKKKKKKKKANAADSADAAASSTPATPPPTQYYETPPIVEEWAEVKNKGFKADFAGTGTGDIQMTETTNNDDGSEPTKAVSISIAPDQPALIIGSQGATIRLLEATTGCKIDVSKDHNVVKITGTASQCDQATAAVKEILDEDNARKARQVEQKLQFDKGSGAVKAIIGKGGATIQDIEKRTGAKLDVNIEEGTCVVTGEQPQVDQAVTMCNNAVYGESQDTIDLKKRSVVNVVYGKNFETIRRLQDESGAKLDLDRSTNILKLAGSNEQVATAKTLVANLLAVNKGVEFPVKAKLVGAIYGKSGSTIRSIQDRTNTFIEVDDNPNGVGDATCCIMGDPAGVAEARRLVQMALDGETELKPGEVLHTLDLGPGAPAVIGKGGSKVAELEKRHTVKIKVNSESAQCRIVGLKKNADAAKDEIELIIKPKLEEMKIAKLAQQAAENGGAPEWSGMAEDDELDGW